MITQSGPLCDVCGKYILPLNENEKVNMFSIKGIEQRLFCHNECKLTILNCGNEWAKLPHGPLRQVFEEALLNKI